MLAVSSHAGSCADMELHFSVSISAYPAFRPTFILQDVETVWVGKCIALFCSAWMAFGHSTCSSGPRHADSVERYIILALGMRILFIRFRTASLTKEKRYNIPNSPIFTFVTIEIAIIDKMRLPLVVVMASVAGRFNSPLI